MATTRLQVECMLKAAESMRTLSPPRSEEEEEGKLKAILVIEIAEMALVPLTVR